MCKICFTRPGYQGRRSIFRMGGGGGKSKKNVKVAVKLCMFDSVFM